MCCKGKGWGSYQDGSQSGRLFQMWYMVALREPIPYVGTIGLRTMQNILYMLYSRVHA